MWLKINDELINFDIYSRMFTSCDINSKNEKEYNIVLSINKDDRRTLRYNSKNKRDHAFKIISNAIGAKDIANLIK